MSQIAGTAVDEALQVKLEILWDEDAESPREWENLGKMVCWHPRYKLGDRHGFIDPEEFERFWTEDGGGGVRLPLFLMDHSGLSMSCSDFGDPWDSGQVGWIYISPTDLAKKYGPTIGSDWYEKYHPGKTVEQIAAECLRGEVRVYDQYLRGEVYGFVLVSTEPNGDDGFGAFVGNNEVIDSCWGFYGDPKDNGMKEHVDPKYHHLFDEVQ